MNNELTSVWNLFISSVAKNKNLTDLYMKLDSGSATYKEAQEFSSSLSSYLVDWLAKEYPNDSKKVLDALRDTNICKNFYKKIDDYVYKTQKDMNVANNLGMNAVKVVQPSQILEQDTTYTDDFEKDIETFANKAELSSNKHVDTIQQANAKFQSKAGFGVTVSRKYDGRGLSDGRSCKWCLERARSNVPYDQAVKSGMFQRHEGCHCMIEYNNNGKKSYQNGIGGRDSWSDPMGYKQQFEIQGKKKSDTKIFQTYESKYQGIYTQTYSTNAQKMIEYMNNQISSNEKYKDLNGVVIVKNSSLKNIAGYEQETNLFYISEELMSSKKLKSFISSDYFPSKNLEDIIIHELGGHKAHWDAIKRYANKNDVGLYEAKQQLEEKLRKYVKQKMANNTAYIQNNVSINAYDSFIKRDYNDLEHDKLLRSNNLNELIADAKVLMEEGQLTDSKLEELVKEVIEYDVSTN